MDPTVSRGGAVSPALQLRTLFVLGGDGRILATREPSPSPVPLAFLVRGATSTAFAVRAGAIPGERLRAESHLSLGKGRPCLGPDSALQHVHCEPGSLAVARKFGLVEYALDWSLMADERPAGGSA